MSLLYAPLYNSTGWLFKAAAMGVLLQVVAGVVAAIVGWELPDLDSASDMELLGTLLFSVSSYLLHLMVAPLSASLWGAARHCCKTNGDADEATPPAAQTIVLTPASM